MRLSKSSLLTIEVVSVISTIVISTVVNAVNKYGQNIRLATTKGGLFLGMTWTAIVALSFWICVSILQYV